MSHQPLPFPFPTTSYPAMNFTNLSSIFLPHPNVSRSFSVLFTDVSPTAKMAWHTAGT